MPIPMMKGSSVGPTIVGVVKHAPAITSKPVFAEAVKHGYSWSFRTTALSGFVGAGRPDELRARIRPVIPICPGGNASGLDGIRNKMHLPPVDRRLHIDKERKLIALLYF